MSDATDLFSALGQPRAEAGVRHQAASPLQHDRHRAVGGIWLLVIGVYGTHDFMVRYNVELSQLATALVRHPQGTASAFGFPILWCATAVIGCLWAAVGVRNARAPHDVIGLFCVFCLLGVCTYALVDGIYLDDAPVASWYLRGLYLATLGASVMELFVYTRWAADEAVRLGERQVRPGQGRGRHQF